MGQGYHGKASRLMLIVERHGLPVIVESFSATGHEMAHVETIISKAHVLRPKYIGGDKAYSSPKMTRLIWQKYHVHLVAPDKRHYVHKVADQRRLRRNKRRWKIERCFSWFKNFRRLQLRWEYYYENFQGFVHLAAIQILLRVF